MTKIYYPSLIALSGDIGAGKTTVARCLRQSYGYEIRSFAAPIKDYLLLLGVPFDSVSGTPEQKSVPTDFPGGYSGRDLMIGLAEWTKNHLGADVFANVALYRPLGPRVVFDDLRFPAEWREVRHQKGVVWHVTRDANRLPEFPVDFVVVNDGDLPQLYDRIAVGMARFSTKKE